MGAKKGDTMKKIRTQIHMAMDFWARELGIFFFMTIAIFLMMTVFSWYLFKENPDMADSLLAGVIDKFQSVAPDGEISMIRLFRNNLQASFIGAVSGLIPFLFLPLMGILANSAVMGLVLTIASSAGIPAWKALLFGIAPHGIFELTAVFLCYAMGLSLCWGLTKKITGHGRGFYVKDHLLSCLRLFFVAVIPLLLIAAAIESWVTPIVAGLMLATS